MLTCTFGILYVKGYSGNGVVRQHDGASVQTGCNQKQTVSVSPEGLVTVTALWVDPGEMWSAAVTLYLPATVSTTGPWPSTHTVAYIQQSED